MKRKYFLPTKKAGVIYIYCLVDPETKDIRYIGRTNDPQRRYTSHVRERAITGKSTHRDSWIVSLQKKGMLPVMEVLEEATDSTWAEREQYWIAFGQEKGWKLTNHCGGGKGATRPTQEARKRMSESHKGHKLTPRQRTIAIENFRPQWSKPSPRKGKRITWSHKISASKMGHVHSDEARQNQSEARVRYYDRIGRKSDIAYDHLREHPEDMVLSSREIGRRLGLGHHHVSEAKRRIESEDQT